MLFAAALAALVVVPTSTARAGAVLTPAGTPAPLVSIRMAIAPGAENERTTRWSEVTVPPGPALGWLVPIRPGAVVDWAPATWLSSLDDASAPRILMPKIAAPCDLQRSVDQPAPWVEPAAALPSSAIAFPATAADAATWATAHGLTLGSVEADRVRALYTSGWKVAAIELAASDGRRTSPTLRVTDDGGPVLPLSIGMSVYDRAVTLFVVGAGTGSLAGTRELGDAMLTWGSRGSSYTDLRAQTLRNGGWLRESASHALFDETDVTISQSIAPVVATYFDDPDCALRVQSLGASAAPQPATALTCDAHPDLAYALAGIAPASAVLTRLAGVLSAGAVAGTPAVTITSSQTLSPVRTAMRYDHACPAVDVEPPGEIESPTSSSSSGGSPRGPSTGGGRGSSGTTTTVVSTGSDTTVVYVPSDGCSGDTTAVETDDSDDSYYSSDSSDSSSSDDSCSGDSTSSSTDGWDSSDSSSSDDSCSGDSTSSSSDGWDTSDSGDCALTRAKKRRGPNRFSRGILFAVALLLPLRRLSRRRSGELQS